MRSEERNMRRTIVTSMLLALVLAAAGVARAQEQFGGLAGVVSDASHLPVPGATVTATNKETAAIRTAVSGADGGFRIPDLQPGRYSVSIELSGFQKVQIDDMLVLLGKTFTINPELKVGQLS